MKDKRKKKRGKKIEWESKREREGEVARNKEKGECLRIKKDESNKKYIKISKDERKT